VKEDGEEEEEEEKEKEEEEETTSWQMEQLENARKKKEALEE
jgi:hypothetical protein